MTIGLAKAHELHDAIVAAKSEKNVEEVMRLLQCVRDEVEWSWALSKRVDLLSVITSTMVTFPNNSSLRDLVQVIHTKFNEDLMLSPEEVEERWWTESAPPTSERTVLVFQDVTAKHKLFGAEDVWQLEEIDVGLDELFIDAFVRFGVRANKKHRHPFLPALNLDVVLPKEGAPADPELINIHDTDAYSVRSVLARIGTSTGQPNVIQYVRNDDNNLEVVNTFTIYSIAPWDRVLPAWFPPVPSTWLSPVAPPSYEHPTLPTDPTATAGSTPTTYKKVPLLHYPGNGRNILPTTTVPPLVASHIFIPVRTWSSNNMTFAAHNSEADHVLSSDKLALPLSEAQARTLLGRVIQYSLEPLPEPEPETSGPAKKKARKTKPQSSALGLMKLITAAWGYDPATQWLYCTDPMGRPLSDLVIDVSAPRAQIRNPRYASADPFTVDLRCAYWIGVVSTADDRRIREEEARGVVFEKNGPEQTVENSGDSKVPLEGDVGAGHSRDHEANADGELTGDGDGDSYMKRLNKILANLNASNAYRIFEVATPNDALLVGDALLSKSDLDFDVVLTGLKPGIWRSVVRVVDDRRDINLLWVQAGHVDYDNLVSVPTDDSGDEDEDEDAWEPVGSFSVDSGTSAAIMRSALESDVLVSGDMDSESALEVLIDKVLMDGEGENGVLAVPGGVISAVDDGGYEVVGRRDVDGGLIAVRVTTAFNEF
ncbi:hypothetical protein AcV5_003081 [Taiwanofungus camphoratus]|nr:hypothetical protein AcV5_003081 [Antrodia cinnamomea]